jgi:hypothetical protein
LVTTSGIPSILEAITGILHSPASILTIPRGSLIDGTTKISKFLIKFKGFDTFPTNLILLLFLDNFFKSFSKCPSPPIKKINIFILQ